MTQFCVQLPAGDIMTLDLDLHTATVATVKAIVDIRVESTWRASGVRILRSDLPFCGIRLKYQNKILAMDEVLSNCKVREGTTLYADWPQKSEKNKRRTRYGKGWDDEAVSVRRVRGNKAERYAEKKALREAIMKRSSMLVENTTQSVPKTGADGDRPGNSTELEAPDQAESDGNGTQVWSEQVANEEQHEQQAEEGEQDDGPAEAVAQDPFADEDDNKENREPEPQVFAPVEETPVDASPAEEWLAFDESNSGLGLDLLEVVEF